MKTKKAFTLIELLVVISIIAMLLAILMPALGMVKEKARAVVCKSNMHQWGIIFQLYTEDNDGFFHAGWDNGKAEGLWLHALRPYYTKNNDVRTCPSATKLVEGIMVGGGKFAWGNRTDWVAGTDDPFNYGSYTLNGYVCSNEKPSIYGESQVYWRKISSARGSLNKIPMLLDGSYWKSYVQETNPPAPSEDYSRLVGNIHGNYMATHCIDRHNGSINAVFFDLTADKVNLKSLWSLRWNPVWQERTPVDWPDWMRKFKE